MMMLLVVTMNLDKDGGNMRVQRCASAKACVYLTTSLASELIHFEVVPLTGHVSLISDIEASTSLFHTCA